MWLFYPHQSYEKKFYKPPTLEVQQQTNNNKHIIVNTSLHSESSICVIMFMGSIFSHLRLRLPTHAISSHTFIRAIYSIDVLGAMHDPFLLLSYIPTCKCTYTHTHTTHIHTYNTQSLSLTHTYTHILFRISRWGRLVVGLRSILPYFCVWQHYHGQLVKVIHSGIFRIQLREFQHRFLP